MGSGLATIYLDIDHFVEINDALGYDQGDRLLVELTRRLKECQQDTDLVSRVSSDEFVLAFPDAPDHPARTVSERHSGHDERRV